MNINEFFNKFVDELDLGKIVDGPIQVTGGLTHRMFKIFTDKGKYIVKLLNPNIMKRQSAFDNCYKAGYNRIKETVNKFIKSLNKQTDLHKMFNYK